MKLCGKMHIAALYKSGRRFVQWPVRISYRPAEQTRILIWAPKSLFKHAVDRNRLRRQMREAYRLNQEILTGNYEIAINYIDPNKQDYAHIERGIRKALAKIHA